MEIPNFRGKTNLDLVKNEFKKNLTQEKTILKPRSNYIYGFNGKEKDNEWAGVGNSYDFGARIYDPRVGRFLSIDPKAREYPSWSPYVYAIDNPIVFTDENGEGPINPIREKFYTKMGTAAINAVSNITVFRRITNSISSTLVGSIPYITAEKNTANKFKGLYVIAQYRLENSFDRTPPGNNPFNIKGKGDLGQIPLMTTEYVNGKKLSLSQNFAKFSSVKKGFEGYFNLLKDNFPTAYKTLTNNSKTIEDFAYGLQHGVLGKFGTDPNYSTKIKSILGGVVNDYEQMYNEKLTSNLSKIDWLNKKLDGFNGNNGSKVQSITNQIDDLQNKNKSIKKNINELNQFKEDEGLK